MTDTTLAILAGGQGSRMGKPKAQLKLNNIPVLQYLLTQFAWPGPTLLITAPALEHPPASELFDHEATDPVAGQGPLRGILTALENTQTPIVIVTTVDMPAILSAHLHHLSNHLNNDPQLQSVMFTREGSKLEPFPAAFRLSAIATIKSQLNQNRLSVHSLTNHPHFATLPAPEEWPSQIWTNLNHPKDLTDFFDSPPKPR